MTQGTIHARLTAAVARAGVRDDAGVLEHNDETMPLCDAIRLAEKCGMGTRELLGDLGLGFVKEGRDVHSQCQGHAQEGARRHGPLVIQPPAQGLHPHVDLLSQGHIGHLGVDLCDA
jgi:hypothetical protein